MFLPLKDMNPTERKPIVTISLIVINVLVYLYQMSLGPGAQSFIASFGATPFEITRFTDLVGQYGYNIRHFEWDSQFKNFLEQLIFILQFLSKSKIILNFN